MKTSPVRFHLLHPEEKLFIRLRMSSSFIFVSIVHVTYTLYYILCMSVMSFKKSSKALTKLSIKIKTQHVEILQLPGTPPHTMAVG